MDAIHSLLEPVARGLEVAGVAAILIATVCDAAASSPPFAAQRAIALMNDIAPTLAAASCCGLEFLVGADIISTVIAPLTWQSVGLLGAIVLIRTLLSFSLETEIEGVAPWRRRETEANPDEQR